VQLTESERIQAFRPVVTLARLDTIEAAYLSEARRAAQWQLEVLKLQLFGGTPAHHLTLASGPVAALKQALARALVDTAFMASFSVYAELAQVETIRRGKEARFSEEKPRAGEKLVVGAALLAWYNEYAVRVVAEEQVWLLGRAKQLVHNLAAEDYEQQVVMGELDASFTGWSRNGAQRIARTETARVYNQARYEQFEQQDGVIGYEITAILDRRTCPLCRARNGKRIPKDSFGGWRPPFHDLCRCTLVPCLDWETVGFDDPNEGPALQPGFGGTSLEIPAWHTRAGAMLGRLVRT